LHKLWPVECFIGASTEEKITWYKSQSKELVSCAKQSEKFATMMNTAAMEFHPAIPFVRQVDGPCRDEIGLAIVYRVISNEAIVALKRLSLLEYAEQNKNITGFAEIATEEKVLLARTLKSIDVWISSVGTILNATQNSLLINFVSECDASYKSWKMSVEEVITANKIILPELKAP